MLPSTVAAGGSVLLGEGAFRDLVRSSAPETPWYGVAVGGGVPKTAASEADLGRVVVEAPYGDSAVGQ